MNYITPRMHAMQKRIWWRNFRRGFQLTFYPGLLFLIIATILIRLSLSV